MIVLFVLFVFKSGYTDVVAMPFPDVAQCEVAQVDLIANVAKYKMGPNDVLARHVEKKA